MSVPPQIVHTHNCTPLTPHDSPKTIGALIKYRQILSNIVKYRQILSNIVKYRLILFGKRPHLPTDKNACLGLHRALPTDKNACLGLLRSLPTDKNACLGLLILHTHNSTPLTPKTPPRRTEPSSNIVKYRQILVW